MLKSRYYITAILYYTGKKEVNIDLIVMDMWGLYVNGKLMDIYYSKEDIKWAYIIARGIYGYSALVGYKKFPKNWVG